MGRGLVGERGGGHRSISILSCRGVDREKKKKKKIVCLCFVARSSRPKSKKKNAMRHLDALLLFFFSMVSLVSSQNLGQDKAEVDIRVSGACSPIYLSRRGIDISKYRPSIRFNPDKIQLVPKNPVIPGCIKIKAEGVEILKPVEMRVGGTPDPNNPTLPCSKKVDEKVNNCPCAKLDGSCVFCDFCKQMRSQSASISVSRSNRQHGNRKQLSDIEECQCDEMQPGLYDIETEMCTPEIDDVKEYIPAEIQNDILEKRPISMFITVYLMDLEQTSSRESFLSAFGRAILQRRMAHSTVACFLLGIDVKISPGGTG